MSEKKQLNEEQLEKVTGGNWGEYMSKYLPNTHGEHIGADNAKNYINRDFYIVADEDRHKWYSGTLIASAPNRNGDIFHTIYIKGKNDYFCCNFDTYQNKEFNGSWWTLFLYN